MIESIKQLVFLGGPLAVAFVSQMAISFTDAALVARLGPEALAAVTLALGLFSLVMLMGLGIITAVSPMVAESFRCDNKIKLNQWFSDGNWLSLIIGVLSVVIFLSTKHIFLLLGQDEYIADLAQKYNNGAAIGIIFFYIYVNIRGFMSAVGDSKPLTWIMLAAIPANFILSFFLIFGLGSFRGLGVYGAGLGSTTVRLFIIVVAFFLLLQGRRFRSLKLSIRMTKIDWARISYLFRLGTPIGFRILVGEGFPSVIAFMIATYGADAVAAHTIGIRIDTLISVLVLGISTATTTVAAWYRVDADKERLRQLRLGVAILAIGYVIIISGLVYFSYSFILSMVFDISDYSTASLSQKLLPLVLLSFAFGTLGTMYNGLLVGLLDTVLPTIVVTASYWGVGLVGGYIVSEYFDFGFTGYWYGMIAASLIVALFNYVRVGYLIENISASLPVKKREE